MRMIAARGPDCWSRLECDQRLQGELGADRAAHAASCARCTALLATHRDERAMFAVPLALPPPRRARWIAASLVAALCAAWLVGHDHESPETRTKGKPAIGFYVKHGDAIRRGAPGDVVFPRDALDFVASSDRPAYLAILSRDGAGTISVYYPDGPITAPIAAGADQLLPLSVRLDDVLGPEQLYGVFCDQPVATAPLEAAVRGAAWPAGCVIDTLAIEKRAAP